MSGIKSELDMLAPIDIFKLEAIDRVIWVASVDNIQPASVRIAEFMKKSPCKYLITHLKTHRTWLVKPDGQISSM